MSKTSHAKEFDKLPYYIRLKQALLVDFQKRAYKSGDRLPSEKELGLRYSYSPRTIKRALFELEKEGVVCRMRGVGTFLQKDPALLAGERICTFGVLFSDMKILLRPTSRLILRAVEEECVNRDHVFHLYSSGNRFNSDQPLRKITEFLPQTGLSGLILLSPLPLEDIACLRELKVPLISYAEYENSRVPAIVADFYQMARLATFYLLERGHRRIALLTGPSSGTGQGVVRAAVLFRKALDDAYVFNGIRRETELVSETDYTRESGEAAMQEMLSCCRPEAVICTDDLLALGAIDAISKRGLRVPEDISVIGSNDSMPEAGLTTLRLPFAEMGRIAVETLEKMASGIAPEQLLRRFPAEIVEGESCASRLLGGNELR
jgi:LacI family transcriptional regulator